jgi:hypothetical protein
MFHDFTRFCYSQIRFSMNSQACTNAVPRRDQFGLLSNDVCARPCVCWCFISLVEWRFWVYMFRNLSYVCMFFIVAFFQHPWNLKFRRINWPLLVKQLSIDVLYVPLMGKRQFLLRYVYLGLLFSTMFLINTLPLLVYAIRDYIWVCYF